MKKDSFIGIFDSGIGGLTVLKEVIKILPSENVIYLGDTARVPYGIRSPETVIRYSFECAQFLLKQNIKILVIACNTASAVALTELKKKIPIPVIGVIEPGAIAAVSATRNKRIGIIGTQATIMSNAYQRAIKEINKEIEVIGIPCPLFVPLVEEGWIEGTITYLIAERYLSGLKDQGVDTVVLGCTHYPLLKDVIQQVMGRDIVLIDSAIETAKIVSKVLSKEGLARAQNDQQIIKFFVTDSPKKFVEVGERFLERKIENIEKISL